MGLTNFIDKITTVTAAWLNQIDNYVIGSGSQAPFARTAQEIAAGVTPTNFAYRPGDVRRYGAVGDGITNDAAAWNSAVKAGHQIFGGGPEYTYLVASIVGNPLPGSVSIDGQGCTIKVGNNIQVFVRNTGAWPAQLSTTVSSGATVGSRSFTVASTTGAVVGQWCRVTADNSGGGEDANSYPSAWSKIVSIVGNVISVNSPLPCTYNGSITLQTYTTSQILPLFQIENVTFDGSLAAANPGGSGLAIRISGYESVSVENCKFLNFNAPAQQNAMEIFLCVDVRINSCRVANGITGQALAINILDCQDARSCIFSNNFIESMSFGIDITRCQMAEAIGNHFRGHVNYEQAVLGYSLSVRGIKFYGCAYPRMIGNHCEDYESPLKFQACGPFICSNNICLNGGLFTYSGQVQLNVGSINPGLTMHHGIISNNIVRNAGGVGIGISTDSIGSVIVTGNQVYTAGAYGIYLAVKNAIISNNRVEDWDTLNLGLEGIHYGSGATVTGNRFYHSTDATKVCMGPLPLIATFTYSFRDNAVESANPLFTGGAALETVGNATIASGTTSIVVNHGLIKIPASTAECTLTAQNKPTNAPRQFYIDTITSTQFTIHSDADPGAGGVTVAWRWSLKMPFTA